TADLRRGQAGWAQSVSAEGARPGRVSQQGGRIHFPGPLPAAAVLGPGEHSDPHAGGGEAEWDVRAGRAESAVRRRTGRTAGSSSGGAFGRREAKGGAGAGLDTRSAADAVR